MGIMFDASEVFQLAIRIEENGEKFYRRMVEKFDEPTIKLCEHAATLLGTILDVKRRDDRWLISKAIDSGGRLLKKLLRGWI